LKKLCENYESEKADLQNIIRTNCQKLKERRKALKKDDTRLLDKSKEGVTLKVSETIEIKDSDEEDEASSRENTSPPRFKKICKSGRIQSGTSSIYKKNDDRSLLKPKLLIQSGRSLLKTGDDVKKFRTLGDKSPVSGKSMVLNTNKVLITEMK
jgi:hypothetical protein